jgi:hypothetical protein
MSEENNKTNDEIRYLEVFGNKDGKQLNSRALDGQASSFTLNTPQPPCQKYAAGHHFHWIPVFRYSQPRVPITAKWLEGDQFEIQVEGETVIWRHHNPERLKEALEKAKPEDIRATQGRPWIFIEAGDGAFAFNCSEEELVPCIDPIPPTYTV